MRDALTFARAFLAALALLAGFVTAATLRWDAVLMPGVLPTIGRALGLWVALWLAAAFTWPEIATSPRRRK